MPNDLIDEVFSETFDEPESVKVVETSEAAERRRAEWKEARDNRVHGERAKDVEEFQGATLEETPDDMRNKSRTKALAAAKIALVQFEKSLDWLSIDHKDVIEEFDYEKELGHLASYVETVRQIVERYAVPRR